MKRVVISLVVVLFIASAGAHAQAASCTLGVQSCWYGNGPAGNVLAPTPPATAQCGNSTIGCVECTARTNSHDYTCAPTGVANDCPGCPPPAEGGSPINTATGNSYIVETDFSIPGLGGGLRLTRKWNSIMPAVQRSYPFMFGANWRSNFEQRLVNNASDGFLKFAAADSSVSSYGVASYTPGSGAAEVTTYNAVVPATDTTTTITENYDGTNRTWTLVAKNGEKRIFDGTSGVLLSITDRNGNVTQLSYDSSKRLTTVADPAGRHLYFNYGSPSSSLVSSVTSDFGITVSYAYDSQGRLTQVTKPDSTTISFAYDANSYITSVTDSNGKVLESHTYDASGRGLTSSRANGVDAVTLSY